MHLWHNWTNQTHKQANLTDTPSLESLRMTSAEAVEMSVTTTCNSLSQDYTNLDNHILQTSIATYLIKNNIYTCTPYFSWYFPSNPFSRAASRVIDPIAACCKMPNENASYLNFCFRLVFTLLFKNSLAFGHLTIMLWLPAVACWPLFGRGGQQ